LNSDI
jgi:hypothetical protein